MKNFLSKMMIVAAVAFALAGPVNANATTINHSLTYTNVGEDSGNYVTPQVGLKTPELWIGASGSETQLTADIPTLNNMAAGSTNRVVPVTAATLTVTQALHDGKTIYLNKVDGIAVTLPHATGTGMKLKFVIAATITSVGDTIKVPASNPTDSFIGMAWVMSDDSQAVLAYLPAAGDDTITLNGTTKGGYAGCEVNMTDVATGVWEVNSYCKATGTEATPFSATVS